MMVLRRRMRMHIVISELLKAYLPISSFKYFLPFTSSFSSFATAAAAGASTSQPASQPSGRQEQWLSWAMRRRLFLTCSRHCRIASSSSSLLWRLGSVVAVGRVWKISPRTTESTKKIPAKMWMTVVVVAVFTNHNKILNTNEAAQKRAFLLE